MKLAPLNVPLDRRLQTLAVLYLFTTLLFAPLFTWILLFYLMRTAYWPLVLLYAAWFYFDFHTPKRGSYRNEWAMRLPLHKWYADYFPVKLHLSEKLPEDKNYLIGYHPHGIYSLGAIINFSTNATGVIELVPKISFHLCTLVGQFFTPIRREWAMLHGIIECSRESLHYMLNSEKQGNACVLVVGGAEESMDAHPGMTELTLMKRKGFIKVALETGASLVPCYSFGENELFEQAENPKGSRLRVFQTWTKSYLGIPPLLFHGRGIFNYSFGILPYRNEINTVLGRPIHVVKIEHPDQAAIDDLHSKYIKGLQEVFHENKQKYGFSKDAQLNIV